MSTRGRCPRRPRNNLQQRSGALLGDAPRRWRGPFRRSPPMDGQERRCLRGKDLRSIMPVGVAFSFGVLDLWHLQASTTNTWYGQIDIFRRSDSACETIALALSYRKKDGPRGKIAKNAFEKTWNRNRQKK